VFRRSYEPLLPGCFHVETPWTWRNPFTEDPDALARICAALLEREIEFQGPDTVAAFIAEPIQGAGGVIVPPDTYWPEIARICKARNILLVADEVISGFGRTGSWFGHQHYGFEPDLAPVAKGLSSGYLPIGGVLVGDRVAEVIMSTDFNHGYTYSGHPVCAVAALENLRIIEEEKLVERVRDDIGPYFARAWSGLLDHDMVGEAQSVGLMGGLQMAFDKKTRKRFEKPDDVGSLVRNKCIEMGLIMRATGDRMLASPPLIITHEEVDFMTATLRKALDAAWKELR
jgi:putrescine aminotransferase